MTTTQNVSQQTGATLALVKKITKCIIGNRHHITTYELNTIIKNLNEVMVQVQNIMYVYDGISQSDAEEIAFKEWQEDLNNDDIAKSK